MSLNGVTEAVNNKTQFKWMNINLSVCFLLTTNLDAFSRTTKCMSVQRSDCGSPNCGWIEFVAAITIGLNIGGISATGDEKEIVKANGRSSLLHVSISCAHSWESCRKIFLSWTVEGDVSATGLYRRYWKGVATVRHRDRQNRQTNLIGFLLKKDNILFRIE